MKVTTDEVLNALVEYVTLAVKDRPQPKIGSITDVSPTLFGFTLEDDSEYDSDPEQETQSVEDELSHKKEHAKFLLDALVEHKVEVKLNELLTRAREGSAQRSSTKQSFHPLYDEV